MNTINKTELENVLIDVRTAYRLLYLYQRRVMDTIKYVVDQLAVNVVSGYSVFSNTHPRNGAKLDLGLWAWDWLTMYMYEFHCTTKNIPGRELKFAIIIQSDTGCIDDHSDKLNIDQFMPVELSASQLVFIIGQNTWKPEGFHNIEIFQKEGAKEFVWNDGSGKILLAKAYELADFADEEGIKNKSSDFAKFVRKNGISDYFVGEEI